MALLRTKKAEVRQVIQASLKKLDEYEIARQSSIVCNVVIATPEYEAARNISIYLSMPTGEVLTDAIVRHALKVGKKVYVPYLYKKRAKGEKNLVSTMDMASLHSESDYVALSRDKWGIPSLEPSTLSGRARCLEGSFSLVSDVRNQLDVVLVPGVAFDTAMGRLGHGRGYYDRFIAAYQGEKGPTRCNQDSSGHGEGNCANRSGPYLVGLALEPQVLDPCRYLPVNESDRKMDAVAVGDGRIIRPPSKPPTAE